LTIVTVGFWWAFKVWRLYRGVLAETASPQRRKLAYENLLNLSSDLTDSTTAELMLTAAVDIYERKHAAIDGLDGKAQSLVALIGGGAAVFALLAGFAGSLHAILTPLLIVAAACFMGSLVLLLLSLAPVETDLPAITQYNSVAALRDPSSRARIAWRLIETWQQITLELGPVLSKKGRFIYAASLLIVAGATSLLFNFLVLLATPQHGQPNLVCHGTEARQSIVITCKGKDA
jgi:hypothetical protein